MKDSETKDNGVIRTFITGATKSSALDKLDIEGFLDPLVLERFAQYMHKNRFQPDGTIRDSDNWQKGIDVDTYMKSLLRHVLTLWIVHRNGETSSRDSLEESLSAIMFNAQGYLRELLIKRNPSGEQNTNQGAEPTNG